MRIVPNRECDKFAQLFLNLGYEVKQQSKHIQLIHPRTGDTVTFHRGSTPASRFELVGLRARLRRGQRLLEALPCA